MKLEKLLDGIEIELISDENLLQIDVSDISFDSRNIKDNSVFVAYVGESFDSHKVCHSVWHTGKIRCVISEKRLENIPHVVVKNSKAALNKMCLNLYKIDLNNFVKIAVTGTNGKTTTTYMIESILKERGYKVIRIGTIEYSICGKVREACNTTPNMYEICQLINEGKNFGANAIVMEVSSHALKQDRIKYMKFDVSVFTNLTGDHLDYHKDMEDYYQSKKLLFDLYTDKSVINVTHDYGKRLFSDIKRGKISVSINPEDNADIYPIDTYFTLGNIKAVVNTKSGPIEIVSNLIGKHNLENILCSIGACLTLNIDNETVKRGIEKVKNVPGRLEKVEKDNIYYFIDYAHTDDALKNVLNALSFYRKNRIITVFGCGGDRDRTKRARMAQVAEAFSDVVIVTSDNPRTEDPLMIIDDILKGFCKRENVTTIPDRREAIKYAAKIAKPFDIVLIAGKGHEDYQIIGKQKLHFDDKEELLKIL